MHDISINAYKHVPVITLLTPDVAEKYEAADPGYRHWTSLVDTNEIELELHKFITPRLVHAFMGYYSFEGEAWVR
jgi:hypothetical protein